MASFTLRMPAGIAGDVNRAQHHTVETQIITPSGTTGHPTAFGVPVVIDATSKNIRTIAATDTSPSVYGLLVRPYPSLSSQDAIGVGTPALTGPCDVMRRGYMAVKVSGTTAAAKGGIVYVWANTATGVHIQGGLEAADPGSAGSGFALSGATWMGPADANGLSEISFHIA